MTLVPFPSSSVEFVCGPQVKSADTWFDKTQHERGLVHGDACPVVPPTDPEAANSFVLLHYYDLALCLYNAYYRTGDARHLANARKCADAWWQMEWIQSGKIRAFLDGAGPAPRHAGIGGLILRALDGRPELWDWIYEYTSQKFDVWLKRRIDYPELYYNIREGAFCLHYAVWLAKALPDSYPLQSGGTVSDGATKRAKLLADAESIAINYFARLQHTDGSWRYDSGPEEYVDPDGGTLLQTMQPFMVGLLTSALCDLHGLTQNPVAKTSALMQIVKACHHLYEGGPYRRDAPSGLPGVRWRDFWYFYHGGTTVNPTKYEKGGGSLPVITDIGADWWRVNEARQGISTILPAFGYAYLQTKDAWFKQAGDELFDSAYSLSDGQHALMDGTAKNYSQHCRRAGSYLAWTSAQVSSPVPIPAPVPQTTPVPLPVRKVAWATTESKQDAIVAAQWAEGFRFKRNLPGSWAEFEKVK